MLKIYIDEARDLNNNIGVNIKDRNASLHNVSKVIAISDCYSK